MTSELFFEKIRLFEKFCNKKYNKGPLDMDLEEYKKAEKDFSEIYDERPVLKRSFLQRIKKYLGV